MKFLAINKDDLIWVDFKLMSNVKNHRRNIHDFKNKDSFGHFGPDGIFGSIFTDKECLPKLRFSSEEKNET